MNFSPRYALVSMLAGVLAVGGMGCRKPQIRTYTAPKDLPPPPVASAAPPAAPATAKPQPELTYTLPAGWQEAAPNSVSLLSFKIGSAPAEANVSVTPLPNLEGRESMVINMWRDQAGLPAIEEAELAKTLSAVQIGEAQGQMFEVLGAREGGAPLRIVTAFVHTADASWFYKLAGEEALVTAQKPVFVEFLKSVRVHEPKTAPAAPPPASSAPSSWDSPTPEGWTQLTPGNMQVAKFAVPEKDGAKAEVFVSVFPNDTGGVLANLNRWRKQLGLAEVDQAGAASAISPLDPATPEAVLIDLKNEPRALLGAVVPRGGQWWFYKLQGDAPAVAAARDAFVAFSKAPR